MTTHAQLLERIRLSNIAAAEVGPPENFQIGQHPSELTEYITYKPLPKSEHDRLMLRRAGYLSVMAVEGPEFLNPCNLHAWAGETGRCPFYPVRELLMGGGCTDY